MITKLINIVFNVKRVVKVNATTPSNGTKTSTVVDLEKSRATTDKIRKIVARLRLIELVFKCIINANIILVTIAAWLANVDTSGNNAKPRPYCGGRRKAGLFRQSSPSAPKLI